MSIMEPDEWMKRTKLGVLKPRSKELKQLDAALVYFKQAGASPANLDMLIAAFDLWANSKGAGAENSERNKNGAVTDLMNQIIGFMNKNEPAAHLRPANLMKDIKEGAKLMKQGKLKPATHKPFDVGHVDKSKGHVVYEEFTNAELTKAKKGWSDAYRSAELAARGIAMVGRDTKEEERFRRWFGNPDPARVALVKQGIDKVLMAFKQNRVTIVNRPEITLHYVDGVDPFGDMHEGFKGDSVYGYVYHHQAGSGYRVVMGKHFLHDADPIEGAAQTVYHELTHKVLHTKDHVYTKVKSRSLALQRPADALTNADNYAYYAISFIKNI
ncbi:MAG: hypothetical protein EON94_09710 [Caulobacteraceae bacterium]|nr:MAG: hypothetical protein EON94_09710 [Caulobacteraceae bacterium]